MLMGVRTIAVLAALLAMATTAFAQTPSTASSPATPEDQVRAVIADWYARISKPEADHPWVLMAPGAIDGGPGYSVHVGNPKSAALTGPWVNYELASRALKFSYDIDRLRVEGSLARVDVWERGYFYAHAAQATYENAADAMFILERQGDGRWLILAHKASSQGVPPNKITDPMPDLRDFYYSTEGKGRSPEDDAKKAATF